MKIKKTRVRLKDIFNGAVLYVASPWHGITKIVVKGKPYLSTHRRFPFIKIEGEWESERSLCDMGVTVKNPYNGARTFKKLKQAEAYVQWAKRDPETVRQHNDHVAFCQHMDDELDYFEVFEDFERHFPRIEDESDE